MNSVVICDGADNSDGLSLVFLLCGFGGDLADDSGDGHGWTVYSGHEQSSEDDLVEVGIGSSWVWLVLDFIFAIVRLTGEESVELD